MTATPMRALMLRWRVRPAPARRPRRRVAAVARSGRADADVEEAVESDRHAPRVARGGEGETDAGAIRERRLDGVVDDRERLPRAGEDRLLPCDHAGPAQRVDRDARHLLTARALVDVRRLDRTDVGARGGDQLGGAHGRAARRVHLRLAVRLDDLDRREERRGSAASAEPSTEPSEKFGMKTAPVPAASTSGRTSAMRSADHPEVPTRMFLPRSIAARTTSIEIAGVDASTTRSAPSSSERSDRDDSVATSSNPSSSSTTPPDDAARACRCLPRWPRASSCGPS